MTNVELVKQAYGYFGEGNVAACLALMHPQIEWNECRSFPYVTGDGIITGPQKVAQDVFAKIPEYIDGFQVDVKELFGCDEKVVMVGYYTGTWKETGKKFRANATHTWTVRDGKLTNFFQAVDTAEIFNP